MASKIKHPKLPPGIEKLKIEGRDQWLDLRSKDITASVAGALFGVHDWTTAYGLWAEKTGRLPAEDAPDEVDQNAEVFKVDDRERGLYLEPVVAAMIQRARPNWIIEKAAHYYRDPAARLGATPDYFVHDPERGFGIIQVKTVSDWAFRKKWLDPDTRDVILPLWIALQATIEAHLTGAQYAYVAPLTVDQHLSLRLIEVPQRPGLIQKTRDEIAAFWQMIEAGREPPPDYKRDASLIASVYRESNGEEIDLSDDAEVVAAITARESASTVKSAADSTLKEINAMLIHKMGNAARARCGDAVINAPTINRKPYSVKAGSYRSVRVSQTGATNDE